MFIRKLKNRSGSVSVHAIEKKNGNYIVLKSFGSSKDPNEIEILLFEDRAFVQNPTDSSPLFSNLSTNDLVIKNFFNTLKNASVRTIGPELIFGMVIFDYLIKKIKEYFLPSSLGRHVRKRPRRSLQELYTFRVLITERSRSCESSAFSPRLPE
jgi:hypothetical protein